MKHSKHTKGEWATYALDLSCAMVIMKEFPNNCIASIHHLFNRNTEERDANAKLIAAAPELLDILIEMVDELKDNYILGDDSFYSKLEDAEILIKKATL